MDVPTHHLRSPTLAQHCRSSRPAAGRPSSRYRTTAIMGRSTPVLAAVIARHAADSPLIARRASHLADCRRDRQRAGQRWRGILESSHSWTAWRGPGHSAAPDNLAEMSVVDKSCGLERLIRHLRGHRTGVGWRSPRRDPALASINAIRIRTRGGRQPPDQPLVCDRCPRCGKRPGVACTPCLRHQCPRH